MVVPWTPRSLDPVEARAGTAVARWWRLRPSAARLAGGELRVTIVRIGAIAIDPDGAVALIRGGPAPIMAIGGGAVIRGLAQAILGGPDELGAPRPPTVAEQATWALAVAVGLEAIGGELSAEPSRIAPAMVTAPVVVELAVTWRAPAPRANEVRGAAWIALPAAVLDRPPPVIPLARLAAGAAWLDDWIVPAPVVIAHAALGRDELSRLAARDAIVVGAIGAAAEGSLRVGRGEVAVTIADDADRVTVRAPYQRGRMDETLGDDLTVELAVSAGTVAVSARRLLELAPGEVLSLGRPAAGQVELVVGRRVIGRGELIDVDGELAVRVLAVHPR